MAKKQDPMASAVKKIVTVLEPLPPKLQKATLDYVLVLLEERKSVVTVSEEGE